MSMRLTQVSCPGGTIYTIRAGDTLSAIAARNGRSVEALLAANPGINPLNLQIGQAICIPGEGGPILCQGRIAYSIQPGDTFYRIAQQYNVTLQAMLAANPGVDPNSLQVGQVVCIPVPATSALCCVTLSLVSQIPLSQLFPGGVALVKPAATASEAVSVTFAAESLPPPSAFGNFDAYSGQVSMPAATATEPPVVYGSILTSVQTNNRTNWVASFVVPQQIPATASFSVWVLNSAVGKNASLILRNVSNVCR